MWADILGVLMREIEATAQQVFDESSDIQWSITGEAAHRSIEIIDQPARLAKLTVHVMQPKMIGETLPSHLVISVEAFINPEAPLSPAHMAALIRHLKGKLTHWVIAEQSVSWHIHRRERAIRLSEPAHIELSDLAELVRHGVLLLRSLVEESKDIAREEAEYFKAQALWGEAERAYRLWHLLDPYDQRIINALMKQLHSERRWGECVRFLNTAADRTIPERRAQMTFAAAVIAEECLNDHSGALSYLEKTLQFDPNHTAANTRKQRLTEIGLRPRELTKPVAPAPFPKDISENSDYSIIPSQLAPPSFDTAELDTAEFASESIALDPIYEDSIQDFDFNDVVEEEFIEDAFAQEVSQELSEESTEDQDLFTELLSEDLTEHPLDHLQTSAPSIRPAEELTTAPGSVALPDFEEDDVLEDFFEGLEEEPVALPSRPPVTEPSIFVEPPAPFEASRTIPTHADLDPLSELEMDLGLLELGEQSQSIVEDALSPDSIDKALTQLPPSRYLSDTHHEEDVEDVVNPQENLESEISSEVHTKGKGSSKIQNSKGRKRNKKGKKKNKRK